MWVKTVKTKVSMVRRSKGERFRKLKFWYKREDNWKYVRKNCQIPTGKDTKIPTVMGSHSSDFMC